MLNIVSRTNSIKLSYLEEGALLLVDKPLNWTSFDVVNKVRYAIRSKLSVRKYKVGHAGTLDPLASGLLLLCIGKYTKQIESLVAHHKEYTGALTLWADTPSYDAEILPSIYYPSRIVNESELREVEDHFTGDIAQIPPMYSAIKIKGTALYHLARKGKEVIREPRQITIFNLKLAKAGLDKLSLEVKCSKGTYIRTLAYDIGHYLGGGAYLSKLRRTRIGDFDVGNAVSLPDLVADINKLEILSV